MTTGSFRLSAFKCWRRRFPFVVRNLFSFKKLRYWGCWLLLRCGPIIILFQLVDSVSRFLSEKLQNNKIQLRKSFFFFHAFFCSPRPPFLQLRQLVRSFTDFYFLSLVNVSFLPPWPAPHRESGYSADRTRLSLVHSLRLRFTLWESLPETPKID